MLEGNFIAIPFPVGSSEIQLASHIIENWNGRFAIYCDWDGKSTYLVFGEKLKKKLEPILINKMAPPKIRIFQDKDDYKVVVL